MLNLLQDCVLPHFLLYFRYRDISDASQDQNLQASLNRCLSTTMHVYGHPTALLTETAIPSLGITQNMQHAQIRALPHLPLFNIFFDNYGRLCYKFALECPHCLHTDIPVFGDKIHITRHCPGTKGVLEQINAKFQGLTRLLDLPPFASFELDEMTRMVISNPPPSPNVLKKGQKEWITQLQFAVSSHMPSACMSPPYFQLLWICPLMMMPLRRQIAMIISRNTPSSRLSTSRYATTWQHACTSWPRRTTDDCIVHTLQMAHMMMIAFITVKSSLVPLIEGLCAQIYFRFEISVVCSHLLLFFFVKEKTC